MPDDDEREDCCRVCGAHMEYVDCWECQGDGGYHDCGEDCCCCLDKEEITHDCPECQGVGGYRQCTELPHTEAQMAEYYRRTEELT